MGEIQRFCVRFFSAAHLQPRANVCHIHVKYQKMWFGPRMCLFEIASAINSFEELSPKTFSAFDGNRDFQLKCPVE
jgi:hypothetical protein